MNAVTEINPTSEVEAFVNLRRQIHMMPELGGETPATAALVAEKLASWGYEVHRGIGGHGLVGVLRKEAAHAASACVPTWMRSHAGRKPLCTRKPDSGSHACLWP